MASKVTTSVKIAYEKFEDDFKILEDKVDHILRPICRSKKWHYEARLKALESFSQKLETGRFQDSEEIDDFFACTVVVHNLSQIKEAEKVVRKQFSVLKRIPFHPNNTPNEPSDFKFDGLRLYARYKTINPKHLYQELIFEIQIKTFLEHAWSYATHDFSYKSQKIDWARERLAAQIKASLDNIDATISQVDQIVKSPSLDKQNKRFTKKKEIQKYIGGWDKHLLPSNLKRLVETLFDLEKNTGVTLKEIKKAVMLETRRGKGKKLTNLSAYGIIIQSLLNQNNESLIKYLKKPRRNNSFRVFVPDEVSLPSCLYGINLKGRSQA